MPIPSYVTLATIVASHSYRCNAGLDRLTIDVASSWMLPRPLRWRTRILSVSCSRCPVPSSRHFLK